jgi:putative MATE family efflux protein
MNSKNPKKITRGVESLMGNPRKAMIRLAIPTSISLLVTVVYQVTDIIWISGLGADALAISGFLVPFFFFINAVASGLGVGGGTIISQYIGSGNHEEADKTASHTFLLAVVLAIPIIILFLIFGWPLFIFMKAGKLIDVTARLGLIYLPLVLLLFINQAASSILSGEGDTKRVMIGSLVGIVLNIILDPLLIYFFKLGIYGAAVAGVIAALATFTLFVYWLFIKKDSYVSCKVRGFKYDKKLMFSIIRLGYPVSGSQISSSIYIFAVTSIISIAIGTDGVAVFSTGIRFGMNVLMPSFAIAYALTTVTAATIGTRNIYKMKTAFNFSLKSALVITISMAIATFVFAPQISSLFTWAKGSTRIASDLTFFFRIFAWFFPAVTIWMSCIAFFIGIGYSIFDLIFHIIKHMFIIIPFAYIFVIVLGLGLLSIPALLVITMWIHSAIALILMRSFFSRYEKTGSFAF